MNRMLDGLGLQKHPDKTFIGRIERGFDFLGYHFSREGLMVARSTVEQFVARLRVYVRRWIGWATGGLDEPLSLPG